MVQLCLIQTPKVMVNLIFGCIDKKGASPTRQNFPFSIPQFQPNSIQLGVMAIKKKILNPISVCRAAPGFARSANKICDKYKLL